MKRSPLRDWQRRNALGRSPLRGRQRRNALGRSQLRGRQRRKALGRSGLRGLALRNALGRSRLRGWNRATRWGGPDYGVWLRATRCVGRNYGVCNLATRCVGPDYGFDTWSNLWPWGDRVFFSATAWATGKTTEFGPADGLPRLREGGGGVSLALGHSVDRPNHRHVRSGDTVHAHASLWPALAGPGS